MQLWPYTTHYNVELYVKMQMSESVRHKIYIILNFLVQCLCDIQLSPCDHFPERLKLTRGHIHFYKTKYKYIETSSLCFKQNPVTSATYFLQSCPASCVLYPGATPHLNQTRSISSRWKQCADNVQTLLFTLSRVYMRKQLSSLIPLGIC